MSERLSLANYDVVRELCDRCGGEKFEMIPEGGAPAGLCGSCGGSSKVVDLSDTSIGRLVTRGPDGIPMEWKS